MYCTSLADSAIEFRGNTSHHMGENSHDSDSLHLSLHQTIDFAQDQESMAIFLNQGCLSTPKQCHS